MLRSGALLSFKTLRLRSRRLVQYWIESTRIVWQVRKRERERKWKRMKKETSSFRCAGVMFARSVSNAHSSWSANIGRAAAAAPAAPAALFEHGAPSICPWQNICASRWKRPAKTEGIHSTKPSSWGRRANGLKVLHSYLMPEGGLIDSSPVVDYRHEKWGFCSLSLSRFPTRTHSKITLSSSYRRLSKRSCSKSLPQQLLFDEFFWSF